MAAPVAPPGMVGAFTAQETPREAATNRRPAYITNEPAVQLRSPRSRSAGSFVPLRDARMQDMCRVNPCSNHAGSRMRSTYPAAASDEGVKPSKPMLARINRGVSLARGLPMLIPTE